jgi:hypothetical protein
MRTLPLPLSQPLAGGVAGDGTHLPMRTLPLPLSQPRIRDTGSARFRCLFVCAARLDGPFSR